MEERLNSEAVLDIVSKHKESVEGYVHRHDLDIYQINKLIKAETALKDRNSVLNFLRKQKEQIMQKQPRDQALKQDLREDQAHVNRETGQNTLNDLKNDIIDIRQQMTEINTDEVEEKSSADETESLEPMPETNTDIEKDKDDSSSGTALPQGMKSRQKMEEEVDHHFDSLPSDRDDSGIVSSFKDLFTGDEDISDVVGDLKPADIFKEIRDDDEREKAVKAAYTAKKCVEKSRGEKLGYGEISSLVRNGELPVESSEVADLFNYLNEYDYGPEFEFEDVDEAVSGCQALVHRYS